MNVYLKQFSLRQLLVKIIAYIAIFYMLIIGFSIVITAYIFFNLEGYRGRIEKTVYKHTGYKLVVGSLQTKLNNSYLPEIIIQDISLFNPINKKQTLHVNSLIFVFSYSSIWNFEPIFDQVLLEGSKINLEYDEDGNIFLNGININNPDRQTLENTKNSPLDLEQWLLKQHKIKLTQISLTYLDRKNGLPLIALNNVRLGLEKRLWSKHRFYIDIFGKSNKNQLEAELSWVGGKTEDWLQWNAARLKVKTINGEDTLVNTLQQYLPGIATITDFRATTALDASMVNGQLLNLYANFDVNNFQLALADADLVNFPKLGGSLSVQRVNPTNYSIRAKNLMVVTKSGYLFDNARMNGKYELNRNGQLELSNTNLVAINNLLSLFSATNGMSIDGTIRLIKFSWFGPIFKPKNFQLAAVFNDISLYSSRPHLPSLSHISGEVVVGQESGTLNLQLKNSVLNYPHIFLIPYHFQNMLATIDWTIAANQQLTVNLHHSKFATTDFKGWLQGVYTYLPDKQKQKGNHGYLNMEAHVDRVLTSKVGDYLPKAIPSGVHHWLDMALLGGYAESAHMLLKGPLASFPFQDEKGLFYITAKVKHGRLQYVKDWPILSDIMGQFILRNSNITVKAQSAVVEGTHLKPTVVVIPDFTSPNGVYLTALGKASGATQDFMSYLIKTPINKIIGYFPNKVKAQGQGDLDIYLKVPFRNPQTTAVKGTFHFKNNQIALDLPVPQLTMVNGDLGFTEHGIAISSLKAQAFASQLSLKASTDTQGVMHFIALSPDLDYQRTLLYYVAPLSNLLRGRAATAINFTVAPHGFTNLTVSSQLKGVACYAPAPLHKESADLSSLLLTFNTSAGFMLNFTYAEQLMGQINLSKPSVAKLALGTHEYLADPDPDSRFTINANPESINVEEWLAASKLITSTPQRIPQESVLLAVNHKLETMAYGGVKLLPLQLHLQSSHLNFGKMHFESGSANIVVDNQHTYFNLYTPLASGHGDFIYSSYQLKLVLDRLLLFQTDPRHNSSKDSGAINFVNGATSKILAKVPDTELSISNLFYQNHHLGKIKAHLHQEGSNLFLESGVLTSKEAQINFSGINFCFGCGSADSYVDFQTNVVVQDLGKLLYHLDMGNVVNNGRGTMDATVQWNGGFQDFNFLQMVGSYNASLYSGKFLKLNPGLWGGLMSIINLQGFFELGAGDASDIFKQGFYFNQLDVHADILTSQVNLNHIYMTGPSAQVRSSGKVNFANNQMEAYVAITPKLGFAFAVTAGVVTLNPLVGLVVYLGELIFGDPQNKLFTFAYHINGDLQKPTVTRTSVTTQFVKNLNSALGANN